MKTTGEMIEVMTHFANGGEVETGFPEEGEWWTPSEPAWNWSVYDYRIKQVDPYAELKAAAADPTKQIRVTGDKRWLDAGSYWSWDLPVSRYEIREKPGKKKITMLAWYDGGKLFWQSDEYKVAWSGKRVPMQDKVIEVEE